MKTKRLILSSIALSLFSFTGTVFAKGNIQKNDYLPAPNYNFRTPSPEKIELGKNLMFDKILSGNQNISCGTCHHSLTDTGDGLSHCPQF